MAISLVVLWIGLIFLGLQAWWFWYWVSYGELGKEQFITIELVVGASIFLLFFVCNKGFFLLSPFIFFFPAAVWGILKKLEKHREEKITRVEEEKELKNWFYTIEKHPEHVQAYVAIGDIYFKREDYKKALFYYRKAYEIEKYPWILQRIKITEKEDKIKRGEIWICSECSFENPGYLERCKNCGNMRKPVESLKEDFVKVKEDIKKGLLWIVIGPFVIIIPLTIIFFLILLLIYIFKKFSGIIFFISLLVILTGIFFLIKIVYNFISEKWEEW